MFDVVLYRPEIPPNTGNIMRLCANTDTTLHLVHPLGFDLNDAKLRRAGLDYREWADVREHDSLEGFIGEASPGRVIAFTRDGDRRYSEIDYRPDDALLFGPESDGLPAEVLESSLVDLRVRIPMLPRSRSLNLSNAVAVVVFEAWKQNGFPAGL
ncbi:MAG: tRNA (cytidine(34)-2'-O)-methyltransferase [Acidimicrobiia bacterium]|nr:tRNA (cytidine(34)-2'-O)-methyltransferase [Acidimicrobiia bacterium]